MFIIIAILQQYSQILSMIDYMVYEIFYESVRPRAIGCSYSIANFMIVDGPVTVEKKDVSYMRHIL